jgi:hypothetical protein
MAIKTNEQQIVAIERLERGEVELYLLGTSPLIMNRLPKKAKEQLLLPARSLNKAAREAVLKHNPPNEFRDAVYRCRDGSAPTFVHVPDGAIKKAMAQAAIDTPGATKAETGRLVKILDPTVHLYGKPFLHMAVVRQAGINKTPDIRTRAIFPEWACKLTIRYIRTRIREMDIVNLNANAGDITGIGDGRTEKGTFDFGSWEIVDKTNPRWNAIVKQQGRKVQQLALDNPEPYDDDTKELLDWFGTEIVRRERGGDSKPKKPKAAIETVIAAGKNGGSKQVDKE